MNVQMMWFGDAAKARAKQAGLRGLMKAGQHLRTVSVDQAPVDEGTLRTSATVHESGPAEVEVGFHTPYAARQHEELDFNHPKGGKAKYLEDPLRDEQGTIKAIIAAEVRRSLS